MACVVIDSQPKKPLNHYCIVRDDLPTGMKVAQAIHAAGESSPQLPSGTIAVALAAKNEEELRALAEHLEKANIGFTPIVEGDGEYANQLMAIGLSPVEDRAPIRKVVSYLPLIR